MLINKVLINLGIANKVHEKQNNFVNKDADAC